MNANDSGGGSLRQAVIDACPGSTITFDNDYTINLTTGQIVIDKDLTIDGEENVIVVSGNFDSRVFLIGLLLMRPDGPIVEITAGLKNLNIRDGISEPFQDGGCIYVTFNTTVFMENSIVTNCRTQSVQADRKAEPRPNDADGFGGRGGAIYLSFQSRMDISGSSIVFNSTEGGNGGGIYCQACNLETSDGTSVSNNNSNGGNGGGIAMEQPPARPEAPTGESFFRYFCRSATVSDNFTNGGQGGGIWNFGGNVTLNSCTV
jgi:predicted outer membrane repeat protein